MGEIVEISKRQPVTFEGLVKQYPPAKMDEILVHIARLFGGFPSSSRDETDADLTLATYADAVAGLPVDPVRWAVDRFTRGLVEGHNRAFMPTSAEFAYEVRAQFFRWHHENTKGNDCV